MSAEIESNATFDEKDIISIASLDSLMITNRPKETSRRSSRGALATTASKRKLLKFQQLNFTGSYTEWISFKYLFGGISRFKHANHYLRKVEILSGVSQG